MSCSMNWQDFCSLYYDQARSIARIHLNKIKSEIPHWDERIDEEIVTEDASMEALQKTFKKFNPSRGASLTTFLSCIVHNEVVDAFTREINSLKTINEINPRQEAEYTFRQMASRIPDGAMENLKQKLRDAILKLSPIDQCILGYYMENPSTFVACSVAELGVSANFVSVHKNRALEKLPSLMNMSSNDYFDLYEDTQYAGTGKTFNRPVSSARYTNPVCAGFNLEETVSRLCDAINSYSGR